MRRTKMTLAPTSIDDAEAAWIAALMAPSHDALRALLHPDFVAVHSPVGLIHTADEFLAHASAHAVIADVRVLEATIRDHGNTAIVSCLQESRVRFVPDLTPFAIQAAVTRVWLRQSGGWRLAHLQMARRFPPS